MSFQGGRVSLVPCSFWGIGISGPMSPLGVGIPYPTPLQPQKREVRILLECFLVTGRNKVLAKVIFSQACVILSTGVGGYPSMPCRSVPGGWVSQHALQVSPGGWVSQHALQVSPGGVGIPACLASQSRGVPIFRGGCVVEGGLRGDPPIFLGGNFFWFLLSLGIHPPPGIRHRNTVNVRPVRILLECILVDNNFTFTP